MKFQTINGWTKEKMKAQILAKNNGKVASNGKECLYETPDGNHCAAGCFIPKWHPAMKCIGPIEFIIDEYEDLFQYMPLTRNGMCELQNAHDNFFPDSIIDVRDVLCNWIDENVIDT